jgi:MFS family permease
MRESPAGVAFRGANFRYYLMVRVLTTTGSEMQAVAVAWQVYSLTHRPLDLGLVGLAQFLPAILLFLVTGQTADRFPRQRVLQACCAGFALCSVMLWGLTWHGLQSVIPIYAVLLLNGTVRAFNGPAGQAFMPLLVPEAYFPRAVALNSSIFQAATIAGPVAGGLLYAWTGSPTLVYTFAAIEYLAALGLLAGIRAPAAPGRRPAATMGMALEGLRYIRRNNLILGAISLDLFAVLLGGAVALLPVYAREILGIGATGLGILRSAPGVGALAMALVVARWPLRRHAGAIMLWSVGGFGVFTVVFGLSRSPAVSLAALALIGACDMVSVIVRHTLIQLATPDEMRGRVSAVNVVFIGASNEVGQFESGITAQWLGTAPAVVLGGLGAMAIVALWAWRFPALRQVQGLVRSATS